MKRSLAVAASIVLVVIYGLTSCGSEETVNVDKKPLLMVSIIPQLYVVQRIAGDGFTIRVLVGEGQSPHSYEPSPRQMADMAKAALWFRIGVDFEQTLEPKISALYPGLRIANVSDGVTFRTMDGAPDPHVWLGGDATIVMATQVRDTLISLYPERAKTFTANCESLVTDVRASFDALKAELVDLRGQTAYVFHPAFGYLLDELGIRQRAVETGGKEPSQKALTELITRARNEGVTTIFVQAQFPVSAATTLAKSLGGLVVPLDPLAADVLDNLRKIGSALHNGLGR